ncbi:MAG TPA: DUF3761 domain-containing protein [Thermomicrobiales bacterium]|nr:DUF3761 domain-containing protein [Thermomicrobiales bacterium]
MTAIPAAAKQVTLNQVVDANTLQVTSSGVKGEIHLFSDDAVSPVTCGTQQAADFARWALSFNDTPGTVYVQQDSKVRDVDFVWFKSGGQPYLLNEALVRNGWSQPGTTTGSYATQLKNAASLAKTHLLGNWSACGGFDIALSQRVPQASVNVPLPPSSQPASTQPGATDTSAPQQDTSGGSIPDNSGSDTTGTSDYPDTSSDQGDTSQPDTAAPQEDTGTYVGDDGCTYTNVSGQQVSCPVQADSPPAGATAQCNDGTYSFSQHRQGTCSGHGGVAQWLQ